ncbi:glutamate-5-semialdehyde dehydrogenase [Halobacillus karajensis]|uniref:Gamma-glutamyl phosphate reductase n=1 Tax=Halobacillus karajensis TaxID=195088 RepID=A0A024P5T8_9BACI|nr:glutamate-5-semialdehyde dehydrogenase [Halobacillus karajensis]CDQ20505.1 Gamma-glutamyl phosphate reductase [Halobacillus karajensis]CDQ24026.1 Gamma-glutamyl phosphate reductase [Halobacillus karajensis]CDQ27504.1 Gamma-glutamyl phosphate reductase [Halobacillus karajensis]SEH90739.1 glutamate-5-semialdehyde dehydrogenase [Halobacillus karajensis]
MTLTTNVNVEAQAIEAKHASKKLMILSEEEKNQALNHLADVLEREYETILAANKRDLDNGREKGFTEAFMDRLSLSQERIADFAQGLRDVAKLEDPTGRVLTDWTLENDLQVEKVTVPLGVIGMIYEARPNVTVDATGLALKSGNAIVLKGGSSAINSNQAIVEVMHRGLEETKIPKETVQFIASTDRAATNELFTMKAHIDVLIPRGGGKLIQAVVENATVPVLETGVGNCHIYVDENADVEKAINILVNAKTDRPAVCNAAETLVVHKEWLNHHKEALTAALKENQIHVHGDDYIQGIIPGSQPAGQEDWANEYLSTDIAVKAVDDITDAITHIETYGTKHSEAIITEDAEAAEKFFALVDAAALYHNASTRFTDGGALGFGAEIGISTQKLHARGPMGLPALTTVKFLMKGNGQIR